MLKDVFHVERGSLSTSRSSAQDCASVTASIITLFPFISTIEFLGEGGVSCMAFFV